MKQDIMQQSEDIQVIAFKLGDEEYALPITSIQEIIMPEQTTKIPRSPEFIEGIINLRGSIIPIINGRKRFGLEPASSNLDTRIIVLDMNANTIGLTVDSVSEVVHLNSDSIQVSPLGNNDSHNFIKGIGKHKNRLLILLDHYKILNINELESLKSVAEVAKNIKDLTKSVNKK